MLTCDSDFLIYDAVDAVIHTDAVKHLFREEVAAVSKDIMVWKKGAAAHAVLAKVRAKKYGSGNFTTLPNTAMYDVAAILGNDVSKKVRDVLKAKEESSGRGRSPWSVIASLLERDKTTYREPCDGGWRAAPRFFTAREQGLETVKKNHWEMYTAARDAYLVPRTWPPQSTSPLLAVEDSPLLARLDNWKTWPGSRKLRYWAASGLGATSIWGVSEDAYKELRTLRREVARRVVDSLTPPGDGWVVTELSYDAEKFVPLVAKKPATVRYGASSFEPRFTFLSFDLTSWLHLDQATSTRTCTGIASFRRGTKWANIPTRTNRTGRRRRRTRRKTRRRCGTAGMIVQTKMKTRRRTRRQRMIF